MANRARTKKASKKKQKSGWELVLMPPEPMAARGRMASSEGENQRLRRLVADLEKELERRQTELGAALAWKVRSESMLAQRFVSSELQYGDLATLYVASSRLHATLQRQDVLAAIREIVSNLIGAEEMALFEKDQALSSLSLVDSYGESAANDPKIALGQGTIGRVASSGEFHFDDSNGAGQQPSDKGMPMACIPLKVDRLVWGVIVIYRLLPQKDRLTALDYQLFKMLSTQAGIALYSATLRAERLGSTEITA
jgi:K+-sensing histidine kinase KdpD